DFVNARKGTWQSFQCNAEGWFFVVAGDLDNDFHVPGLHSAEITLAMILSATCVCLHLLSKLLTLCSCWRFWASLRPILCLLTGKAFCRPVSTGRCLRFRLCPRSGHCCSCR